MANGRLWPDVGTSSSFWLNIIKVNLNIARMRYYNEAKRLYNVLEKQLEGREFIAGEGVGSYSIADMSCWPWVSRFEWQEIDLNSYPNIKDWYIRISNRPAVQKGYSIPKFVTEIPKI